MKERYKCAVTIQNELMFFKRYGENEEEVRKELEVFISEAYGVSPTIISVEKDKTYLHKKKEEEIAHAQYSRLRFNPVRS